MYKIMNSKLLGFELIVYVILCEGENKYILICDIDTQNIKYVFASNNIHVV
jgi:hypothetical protein